MPFFLGVLLPSFAVEIVMLSSEGMGESCKAFTLCLQIDEFPLERLLRGFLVRGVQVPIPTVFPNTIPEWITSL